MNAGIRKILIRAPNWVGDNIFTFPAVRLLRRHFPEAQLTILVRGTLESLWEIIPEIDEVITFNLKGGGRDLKGKQNLITMLRRRRFDLAVIFPRSFESALWMWLAGIPERWGYAEEKRSCLLTRAVRSPRKYRITPRMDYYYRLVSNAGDSEFAPAACLELDPELVSSAGDFLRSLVGEYPEDRLIGFHPGSSYGPAKCWPARNYGKLAGILQKKMGFVILLFGSEKERDMLEEIAAAGTGIINLGGMTDLKRAAALMSLCRVFVANDSGLLHLAAALGVPVVGLYGSTDPEATGPRGKKVKIIYKNIECSPCLMRECPSDFICMESITPEEVEKEIYSIIDSS